MFYNHLMWLLFSVQHIPSPSWLRRASWPIRPSHCHSSPSAADLCCVIFIVSPLGKLTAAWTLGVQSPYDSRDFCPFLVSGSLLKDSRAEVLNELDCVYWIAHNWAMEGVFLLLCSEDGNIYFHLSDGTWTILSEWESSSLFHSAAISNQKKKRERSSCKTLKTSA